METEAEKGAAELRLNEVPDVQALNIQSTDVRHRLKRMLDRRLLRGSTKTCILAGEKATLRMATGEVEVEARIGWRAADYNVKTVL